MVSLWKAFWAACVAFLLAVALWRNKKTYGKSWVWCAIKSIFDVGIVLFVALRAAPLLCAYVIMWLTKPLANRPVLRVTYGAIMGIAIAFLSGFAIEFVVIAGIFAIDQVTGGAWKYWFGISRQQIDWKAEAFGLRRARRTA
jgi:hypothetical protein